MSKMLLLQETVVDAAPMAGLQPKTLSKLFTDLTGQNYDFAQLTLNGHHGGDIMTATLPNVVDAFGQPVSVLEKYPQPVSSDMWLTLIDSDHTWRSDSSTRLSELYRYHEAGTGQNTVQWEFTSLAAGLTRRRFGFSGRQRPAAALPSAPGQASLSGSTPVPFRPRTARAGRTSAAPGSTCRSRAAAAASR